MTKEQKNGANYPPSGKYMPSGDLEWLLFTMGEEASKGLLKIIGPIAAEISRGDEALLKGDGEVAAMVSKGCMPKAMRFLIESRSF